MGEQKRKRAAEDTGLAKRPKKSRVAEPASEGVIPASRIKSGLSRQEKSERRSKKAKKSAENPHKAHGASARAHILTGDSRLLTPPAEDEVVNGSDYIPLDATAISTKSSRKPEKEKKPSKTDNEDATTHVPATPNSKKGDRFICFVGNLPYNTTSEQLKSHFVKIATGIKSIRLGTDKKTGKGKGYAFLEFGGFDTMKTCLKLYHHSIFDPSVETEDKEARPGQKETGKGRRINVELTAGGGGKSKERKEKIHVKNLKLDEERERNRLKEKEQAAAEKKKEKRTISGANGVVATKEEVVEDRGDIHPSRMNRVARQ